LEDLLEYLKAKIDALDDVKRLKDPNKFFNIVKDIQIVISDLGQQLGIEIPILPELKNKQIPIAFSQSELSIINQKISSLFRRVEGYFLSVRARKCLKRLNIHYVGELVQKSESELLRVRNFGRRSLREVKWELAQIGLHLGMQIPSWPPENLEELINYFAQEKKEELQTQLEQKYKENLRNVPVMLSQEKFIKLLRGVDEFRFSVRTMNCLKDLNIIYIGDLVQKKKSELLHTRNFGRKSLLEIEMALKKMNLNFGMNISGWPPENIKEALKSSSSALNQLRIKEQNFKNKIRYLEDELSNLASLMGKYRYEQIVIRYFGWDGQKSKTLESVGKEFNVTRERIRQICLKFERKLIWAKQNKTLYLPTLDSALKFVTEHLPARYSDIKSELAKKGITRRIFCPEGLITAAKITGRGVPFCIVNLRGNRLVVKAGAVKEPQLILNVAKKSTEHWGVSTFYDIAAQVSEKTNQPTNQKFIKNVLSSLKGFHLLDESGGWFWFSSVSRNRLLNMIQKILSVAGEIDISELRSGISRNRRMEGFSPPRRVLLELCRQLPWCRVEDNMVIADPPLNWEKILAGSTEWAMTAILKEHGLVMPTTKFEELCLDLGMNQTTFEIYISSSPIITKYAMGVYGLRGAKIHPGIIESLKPPKQKHEKVLLDFGWTLDNGVWLGHKISQAMIRTGVFTIPAAMKQFIQGDFNLKAADGVYIGNLKAKDFSGWSLSTFFRRRGGEPGDYLVLTFDLGSHEAKAYIGDEGLLDIFRPED